MHIGTQLTIATWSLTALSLLLVLLRLYTRIRIVRLLSSEDHMYWVSFLFLLAYASTLQIAVFNGLGTDFWSLTFAQSSDAIFWTYVANSFAILGNALAKMSMGLFLLRVVQVRWHKVALWTLVGITGGSSVALTVMLWCQTTPARMAWDPIRTPGKWNIQIQPMSVGLGVWSSAVDFFFAVFPWLVIWSLKMPQRDKIMLAGGMSLGVIAGVCGIIRTVVLARLDVFNYTRKHSAHCFTGPLLLEGLQPLTRPLPVNFVPYFGWAGAEIAVSMVCLGIPTLRPLYMKARGMTIGYGSRNPTLPSFQMCERKPPDGTGLDTLQSDLKPRGDMGHESHGDIIIAMEPGERSSRGEVTRPASAHMVMGSATRGGHSASQNDSVEEILGLYGRAGSPAVSNTWPRYQPRAPQPQWPLKD